MSTHTHADHTHPPVGSDPAKFHGMVAWGAETLYLSHLAMFRHSVHAYQVIMEAALTRHDGLPSQDYREDRKRNPDQRLYSLAPEEFVLPDILPDGGAPPRLTSFTGSLFRGHFEKGGTQIASDLVVEIGNVIHGRRLDVNAPALQHLEYIVFGTGDEVYLAHLLTRPPDFDQVIEVKVNNRLPGAELDRGHRLTVPGRTNEKGNRIQQGDGTVSAILHGQAGDITVDIEPGVEVYFNDDSDLR